MNTEPLFSKTQNPPQHHFTQFVTNPIKLEEPSKQSTQKSNAKNPKGIIPRKHQIYHLCFLHVTAPLLIKQNAGIVFQKLPQRNCDPWLTRARGTRPLDDGEESRRN
ncbi:hypothetical protein ABKV19_023229 [Rosa sericea]